MTATATATVDAADRSRHVARTVTSGAWVAPVTIALLLPLGFVAPTPAGVSVPLLEVAVAAVALSVLTQRRSRPRLGAGGIALAFLGAWVAAGAATGGNATSRLHASVLWLGLAAVFAFCASLRRRDVTVLLGALAFSGVVETIITLAEYADGRGRRAASLGGIVVDARPAATLGHPNALALFLVAALLPALALALFGRGRLRIASALVAAAAVPAVAATYSREALLALGAGILLLAAQAGRARLLGAAAAFAAIVGLLAAVDAPFRERLATTASWSKLDPGGFRVTLWSRALHHISAHPLVGTGAFHEVAPYGRVPTAATHPHELWLGLAALYGIPAALAFSVIVWIGVRNGLAAARQGVAAAAGVTAALAAFLLVGLVDYPFWNETLACTVVLLLGAAVALQRDGQAPSLAIRALPSRPRPRRVAVVVASWNAGRDLHACLESVAQHGGVDAGDVVVVDNGSTDGSVAAASAVLPGAVVIRNAANEGVARARNQGIAATEARYVLVLDADARLTPGALEALCATLDSDPRLGLAGPRLEYPDGGLQASPRAVPRIRSLVFGRPPLSRLLGRHWTVREHLLEGWDHAGVTDVDYVLGACQLVRAEALEDTGLYDERIFYGPEDADLCLRLHERGWGVSYVPDACVVHRYRRMTVRAPLSRQARSLATGWARVLFRHRRRAVPRRLPA